jgi:hypothetical protein
MLGLSSQRVFVYEVEGLRQNDQTIKNNYPVRNSSNLLIQVPLDRMNEEMRRITRLGGNIVAIHPLATAAVTAHQADSEPDGAEHQGE